MTPTDQDQEDHEDTVTALVNKELLNESWCAVSNPTEACDKQGTDATSGV
jgi:hypothetical protein